MTDQNETYESLIDYVTSNDRVYPFCWGMFSKRFLGEAGRRAPLSPLILGGAIAPDADKRQRLLGQLTFLRSDPAALKRADRFLRSLSEDQWYKAPDPLNSDFFDQFWKWGGGGPKKRPSKEEVDRAMSTLRENWISIFGEELGDISTPRRITGKRRRRLVVWVHGSGTPPWGSWSSIHQCPHEFTEFREKVNRTVEPLVVDHIDFIMK